MAFRTWTGGRPGTRRSTTVAATAVAIVLALATAAAAWLPLRSGDAPAPAPPSPTSLELETDAAGRDAPTIDPVWRCPVDGGRAEFRDDYGYRKPNGRIHRGVDLYALLGTPVVAPTSGEVEHSEGGPAGKQVILHTDGDRRYVFAHLSRFGADGDVAAGETIGYVGTSGNARGALSHLHFEIRAADGPVDPFPMLDEHCR